MHWSLLCFVINFMATLYMTGLIWFVQVVHYPLFAEVKRADFEIYESRHSHLTTLVVLPPMVLELAMAIALLFTQIPGPYWLWGLNLSLVLLIWLSTFFLQVPRHNELMQGFNLPAQQALVKTNWIRTLLWSLKSLLNFCFLWFLITG